MSSLPQKQDYVAEGLGYLRQGLSDRPNIARVLTAFLGHAQDIENALQGLADGLLLQNAVGAQLDAYGRIVGVDREGQSDDVYRILLLAAIAANHGDATLQTTVSLAEKLFNTATVFARSPALLPGDHGAEGAFVGFQIGSPGLPRKLWPVAERLLGKNVGAGITSDPIVLFDAKKSFGFAARKGPATSYVAGFGSVKDKTLGAPLAGLLKVN